MSIDRFERALRDDVLLDCIIAAETPPDIENAPISVERAEARIAHLRKCVPQLSAFDDVEVLRLSVQAARARADDMASDCLNNFVNWLRRCALTEEQRNDGYPRAALGRGKKPCPAHIARPTAK